MTLHMTEKYDITILWGLQIEVSKKSLQT